MEKNDFSTVALVSIVAVIGIICLVLMTGTGSPKVTFQGDDLAGQAFKGKPSGLGGSCVTHFDCDGYYCCNSGICGPCDEPTADDLAHFYK